VELPEYYTMEYWSKNFPNVVVEKDAEMKILDFGLGP
jgi:hypothetical protein